MIYKLYVISAGTDAYKIGISRNPKKRLDSMQANNHKRLIIDAIYYIGTEKRARYVEKIIHNRLKKRGQHIIGEWFKYNTKLIFKEIIKTSMRAEYELPIISIKELNLEQTSHMNSMMLP